MGVPEVQSTIAAIEARFNPQAPPVESATSAAFASVLDSTLAGNTGGSVLQSVYTDGSGVDFNELLASLTAQRSRLPQTGYLPSGVRSVPAGALPAQAQDFARIFEEAGQRHGVDPNLLTAVAWTESNFNPSAVSGAGAQGLMQLMPGTAAGLGVDAFDPVGAVDGAARYLREQLDRFGSIDLALAAYNAGPGAVQNSGGIPPYPETQNYVAVVKGRYESLTRGLI